MRNKKLIVNLLSIGSIGILIGGIYLIASKYPNTPNGRWKEDLQKEDVKNTFKVNDNDSKYERKKAETIPDPPFKNCKDMQLHFNNRVDWGSVRQVKFQGFEDDKLNNIGEQQYCGDFNGPYYIIITSPQGKQVCNGWIRSRPDYDGSYKVTYGTKNCKFKN